MELLCQLFGALLAYMVFRPVVFVCQAISGMLIAEVGPRNQRRKFLAVVMLLVGCILLLFSWFMPGLSIYACLVLYAIGFGLLATASSIGYRLEIESLRSREP